jgi:hypothetical protein
MQYYSETEKLQQLRLMKLPFWKQPSEEQRAAMEQNSKSIRADMLWKQGARWLSRKKYSRAIEAMRKPSNWSRRASKDA